VSEQWHFNEAEIHARDWWCPHCRTDVPPEMITKDGEHYLESGGCGRQVRGEIKGEAEEHAWRPIETAPEDENILVATTGGWVDTAFWTDEGEGRQWWWLVSANKFAQYPIHPDLVPTHWMPLPKHPDAK
jgi:hypothetical protein